MKRWGDGKYWGCGADFDPDWMLTAEQLELRDKLIELCRTTIRPRAAAVDRDYIYPRESLEALASLNLLGLLVPKKLGGLGESFLFCAVVMETIARYGCPSTALVYCMHLTTTSLLLYDYQNRPSAIDLLKTMNAKKLIGTVSFSDPATGGHFWFALTSKCQYVSENMVRYLKYGSWCTSAGYADFYVFCTISPNPKDPFDFAVVLCYREDVRAYSGDWRALGMHGNMSGELVVDCELPTDRIIGKSEKYLEILNESAVAIFAVATSACWNGIAMACMDVAKRHVTRNAHGDVGMRVCDYPVVQEHFGKSMSSTSAARLMNFSTCQGLDALSNNNDWAPEVTKKLPRTQLQNWSLQAKVVSSENALQVSDMMMRACGGTGYKAELGMERLLRDARAGTVMSPSNEVCTSLVARTLLLGKESIDFWNKVPDKRTLHQELSKMSLSEKEELVKKLGEEIRLEMLPPQKENNFSDFDNPFNTSPVHYLGREFGNGVKYKSALDPNSWTRFTLTSKIDLTSNMTSFCFALPKGTDHSGLIPGQYIKVRINIEDRGPQERFFSPVSHPSDPVKLEIVLRYESHGIVSDYFKSMKIGDTVECKGPCGGFEYSPNSVDEVTLLASGGGITPGLQLLRTILSSKGDLTKLTLIFYSETQDDILYRSELDNYAASKTNFRLVHTLGEVPEGWAGEEGFIDMDKLKKYVTKDTTDKHKILICGGPNMSLCCCNGLRLLGFKSSQIFVFGQFGAQMIQGVYGRNAPLSSHLC